MFSTKQRSTTLYVHLPGKVEQAPRPMQGHEVVSEVKVCDILAVKEIFRHRL